MTYPQPSPYGLILSGGLALGAYHWGVVEALSRAPSLSLSAVAGSSIGAITGAILAGNAPEDRVRRLAEFWTSSVTEAPLATVLSPFALLQNGLPRRIANWTSVGMSRMTGAPSLFHPRLPWETAPSSVPSLYLPAQTRASLEHFVDFDRLNDGPVRYCCATTDIETGACVLFDTAAGDRITADHVIASGSLLPAFPPMPIDGRLLGDGGFTANAPLEPLLSSEARDRPLLCFLADLFSAAGPVPTSLQDATARSSDLKFACQTTMRLAGLQRERALEARLPEGAAVPGTDLYHLSYRPRDEEPGAEKPYDFSRATLADRRAAGAADAAVALTMIEPTRAAGLRVHQIPSRPRGATTADAFAA